MASDQSITNFRA
jgi:hypothetical protein